MADVAVVAVALTGLTAACYAYRRWTAQAQAAINVPPKPTGGMDTGQSSRQSSRPNSRPASRPGSRPASRPVSPTKNMNVHHSDDEVDNILAQVRDSINAAENIKRKVKSRVQIRLDKDNADEESPDQLPGSVLLETPVLCGFVVKSVDVSINGERVTPLNADNGNAEAPPIEELMKPELKVEAWLNGMSPSDQARRPNASEMFDGETKEHGEGWREEVYQQVGNSETIPRGRGEVEDNTEVVNRLSSGIQNILANTAGAENVQAKSVRTKSASSKTRSSMSTQSNSSSKKRSPSPSSRPSSVVREEPVDSEPDSHLSKQDDRVFRSTTPSSSRGHGSRPSSASGSKATASRPGTATSSIVGVSRPTSQVKYDDTTKRTGLATSNPSAAKRQLVRDSNLSVKRNGPGSKPVITIKEPANESLPSARTSLLKPTSRQVEASNKFLSRQAKKATPSKPSVQTTTSPSQQRFSPAPKITANHSAVSSKQVANRITSKVNPSRNSIRPSKTSIASSAADKKVVPSKDDLLQKGSGSSAAGYKARHKRVLMVKPSAASADQAGHVTSGCCTKAVHGCATNATVTLGPILAAGPDPGTGTDTSAGGAGSGRGRRPANYVWRSMSPIKTLSENERNARLTETLSRIEPEAAELSGDDHGSYKPPRSISEVMDTEHIFDNKLTESEPEMRAAVDDYNPAGQFFKVTSDDLDKCYVRPEDQNIDFNELITSSGLILYAAAEKKESEENQEVAGEVLEGQREAALLRVETEGFKKLVMDQVDTNDVNGDLETAKL